MKTGLRITFAILLMLPLTMFAGNISGKLIDSKSKAIIGYANVALYKVGSKAPYKGFSTGEDGKFLLQNVGLGKYILKVTFVGYSEVELPIALDVKRPDIDLGAIQLTENSKQLGEVKVTGQKSQMRFELDRKVFNVDQNIASAGASASEILKNIPSVEVDVQGNVSLRNNSNVIIWINGRPSGLNEDNRAQVLEQMPAETIDRIEVITNPSSKYSPEGSAGIINIVLKADRKPGYYGGISVGGDTFKGMNGSFNLNYNSKKWDAYANVGFRSNKIESNGTTNRTSWLGADTTLLKSANNSNNKMSGVFSRMGATYHATTKDLIGVGLMLNSFDRNSVSNIGYENTNAGHIFNSTRHADNEGKFRMGSLTFDYTHKFLGEGHEIKASVEYNRMKVDNRNDAEQTLGGVSVPSQRLNLSGERKEWEVQVDYTYPISKESKIEAGFKGEYNDKSSDTRALKGVDLTALSVDSALNNEFNSIENRNSLYFNYSGKYQKLTYQLGLRGEYNVLKNTSFEYDKAGTQTITPFNNDYPGLYPSFFLNYSLPKDNELQLNYTRRINRPHGRDMNPYRDVSDPNNIRYGNPGLTPEYSNSLELNHIKTWNDHSLSSSIYYRTTSDVIQQVNFIADKIKYTTSLNVTNSKAAGFEFILKDKLFRLFDLTNTLNLYYSKLDGFDYEQTIYPTTESFAWTYKSILNLGMPKGWMLQLTGGYQSKKNIAQGEILPSWSVDAGVRKMFFKRKLSLNIMARDLFDSRESRIKTSGYNFTDYSKSKFGGRMFGVSMTYNFGKNGDQKKKPDMKKNGQNGDQDQMNGGSEF